MKTRQEPDKKIHIRKKVAGGTTGAVLGAVLAGPVGALVGGVIGTAVGNAAESGKLGALTEAPKKLKRKSGVNGKGATKTAQKKISKPAKRMTRKASSRVRSVVSQARRGVGKRKR